MSFGVTRPSSSRGRPIRADTVAHVRPAKSTAPSAPLHSWSAAGLEEWQLLGSLTIQLFDVGPEFDGSS